MEDPAIEALFAELECRIGETSALELLVSALIKHHPQRDDVASTYRRWCEKYVAHELASPTSSDNARTAFERLRDRVLKKLGDTPHDKPTS